VRRAAADLLYITGAFVFFLFGRSYLQFPVSLGRHVFNADLLLLSILLIISVFPILRILLSVKRMFDALSTIFSRTTPQPSKKLIIRNLLVSALFFAAFANCYLVVELLMLPPAFNWASVIFGILSIFFFWSAVRAASLFFMLPDHGVFSILHDRILTSQSDVEFVLEDNDDADWPKELGG
jgi:hypothetical protein